MTMIGRRTVLVGGGAGLGLVVAWGLWPRDYAPGLTVGPDERAFGAWLKIGRDGHVTVAVPQAEHGQGVYTTLPQIVADELGADWRTVAVTPAPVHPLYANPLGLDELFEHGFDAVPASWRGELATRNAAMVTAASSSVRMFEGPAREAAAAARALLIQAAARRWDVDWADCATEAGFVTHAGKRLRFAELVDDAVRETVPDPLPIGVQGAGALMGKAVPRLDAPSKVDGSANFTADIRLPDMVHVAVRQGPIGSRLVGIDRAAARRVPGVVEVIETDDWVAVAAATWWTATRALDASHPRFAGEGPAPSTASIAAALDAALKDDGRSVAAVGDIEAGLSAGQAVRATYRVAPMVHGGIETPGAVAAYRDDRLEIWAQTQAPARARAVAAAAADLPESRVTVHAMMIGGSFGAALEHDAVAQAARIAMQLKRPVNLMWSRGEALLHDYYRAPAVAAMSARLGANGAVLGWQAKIAAPATGGALAQRLVPGLPRRMLRETYATGGAVPPYRVAALAVDHHRADIGVPTGHVRGGAHGANCFFNECFVDELARAAGVEPLSFRIGMLGGEPRLARCLSTAASLGGWEGGVPDSGQGIAAHGFRGSYIAVMAEARMGPGGRPVVERLVAAVDCGRMVNPDVVRQQIEGGLIFGLASAIGAATGFAGGLATARGFDRLVLPRLADTPDITVEFVASDEPPGGVGELAVPPVAPAIANALYASGGFRIRTLPLHGAP